MIKGEAPCLLPVRRFLNLSDGGWMTNTAVVSSQSVVNTLTSDAMCAL